MKKEIILNFFFTMSTPYQRAFDQLLALNLADFDMLKTNDDDYDRSSIEIDKKTMPTSFTFGTYQKHGSVLEKCLEKAWRAGIRRFDTARLYKNEKDVYRVLDRLAKESGEKRSDYHVTTKIGIFKLRMGVEHIVGVIKNMRNNMNEAELHGDEYHPIDRLLIHQPLPKVVWEALEKAQEKGYVREIGVSNHSRHDLEVLLRYARVEPCVNHIEMHPFAGQPLDETLAFCAERGIPVQAHTVLGRGMFLHNTSLQQLARKHGCTVAQVMARWVIGRDVADLCISSGSDEHLLELLSVACMDRLDGDSVEKINGMHRDEFTIRFYGGEANFIPELGIATEEEEREYVARTARRLAQDWDEFTRRKEKGAADVMILDRNRISDAALSAPIPSKRPRDRLCRDIARLMFPEMNHTVGLSLLDGKISYFSEKEQREKYHHVIRSLRSYCNNRKRLEDSGALKSAKTTCTSAKKGKSCCGMMRNKAVENAGEAVDISYEIANPEPMPVTVPPKNLMDPYFSWLGEQRGGPPEEVVSFVRGTMFPDGRMDMCKQVVGPTHIESLCDAVKKGNAVRHFLLGNNIACDGGDARGARAMAELMRDETKEIETWYLAGNCMDGECVRIIAEALEVNRSCKALWLKRNPVGTEGARALAKMLLKNQSIELLDLHNCGLLDEGVRAFCDAFLVAGRAAPRLRHLYLDANGITEDSAPFLARFLEMHRDQLETVYVSMNRLGDAGVARIASALHGSRSLLRFCVGSNRLTADSVKNICDVAMSWERLLFLDLGYYKSTYDMGERPNNLGGKGLDHGRRRDGVVEDLGALMRCHPSIQLLSVQNTGLSEEQVASLKTWLSEDKRQSLICGQYKANISDVMRHSNDSEECFNLKDCAVRKESDDCAKSLPIRFLRHPRCVLDIDSIYRNKM